MTTTAKRTAADIAQDFETVAARVRNYPGNAEYRAEAERLRGELADVMPSTGNPEADAIRQQLFRTISDHAEQVARDARGKAQTVERSPHMKPVVERLEQEAAGWRAALNEIAAHADAGWWLKNAHKARSGSLGFASDVVAARRAAAAAAEVQSRTIHDHPLTADSRVLSVRRSPSTPGRVNAFVATKYGEPLAADLKRLGAVWKPDEGARGAWMLSLTPESEAGLKAALAKHRGA